MGRTISLLANDLFFFGNVGSLSINGGMMSVAHLLRHMVAESSVDALEVFLPPAVMLRPEALRQAAQEFVPVERRGQGVLQFYPLHSLPDVWRDGKPRILFCADPEWMRRQRYVRDRFAIGPTPIITDTHTLGHHSFWQEMSRMAAAPPVAFDSIICRTQSTEDAWRRGFAWLHDVPEASDVLNVFDAPQAVNDIASPRLPCRIDRLEYGIDTELFHSCSKAERINARRTLNLPTEGQIALFFGRVTAYSKADLLPLLEAFYNASRRPDDYLLIAGKEFPGGYLDKLREVGDELGLGDRLILRGEAPPVLRPLYFHAADLFVFPGETIVETFGNTVVEAMASGLPIIVSDWDGLRHHVRDGENGRLIPTWWMPGVERIDAFSPFSTRWSAQLFLGQSVWVDNEALTSALSELLQSPALRRSMGEAGRAQAESIYSWPAIMPRWRAIWEELEELAARETEQEAKTRRAYADRLGGPLPHLRLFSHYATGTFHPDRHALRLSTRGMAVATQREQLMFYDETLPLLRQEILDALLATLWQAQESWITIGELTRACAEAADGDEDLLRFHLGLLLKRGALEVAEVEADELTVDEDEVAEPAAVMAAS